MSTQAQLDQWLLMARSRTAPKPSTRRQAALAIHHALKDRQPLNSALVDALLAMTQEIH